MSLSYINFKKYILNDEENSRNLYDEATELNFYNSKVKKLQRIIAKFKNIKVFNVSKNKIVTIPKEIFTMKSLISLNLTDNLIVTLPDELCNLENLETLILISNKLKVLPTNIGKLQKLKILWCSKNELETLPESLSTILSLQDVRFSYNDLISTINFESLVNLKNLYLNNNNLPTVPKGISSLDQLKKLDLSYNKTKTQNVEQNEQLVAEIYELPSIEFFKNDFNVEDKFCSVCKKETNTAPPCGHYICAICANKRMMEKFNDDYETECPTCKQKFKTPELEDDNKKYSLEIKKSEDQNIYCHEIGKIVEGCPCGKC